VLEQSLNPSGHTLADDGAITPVDSVVPTDEASPFIPASSAKRGHFWVWAVVVIAMMVIAGGGISASRGSRQGGPLASQGQGGGR